MITNPRLNYYESTEGFTLEIFPSRLAKFIYLEGDHKMVIHAEMLTGSIPFVIYIDDEFKHWEPPHGNEPITFEKRVKILENIRNVFRFDGYEIDVI